MKPLLSTGGSTSAGMSVIDLLVHSSRGVNIDRNGGSAWIGMGGHYAPEFPNSSKVFSYDAKTYEKKVQEFSVGTNPIGVVSAANDSKLYVTNYGDNTVSVIKLY